MDSQKGYVGRHLIHTDKEMGSVNHRSTRQDLRNPWRCERSRTPSRNLISTRIHTALFVGDKARHADGKPSHASGMAQPREFLRPVTIAAFEGGEWIDVEKFSG